MLTGTLTVAGQSYDLVLGGMLISSIEDPFPGRYTFRLPGNSEGSNPRGTGYATGVLARNGVLKLQGRLPDWTPFSATIPLQYYGILVVNLPLYRGGGYLHGILQLDQNGAENAPTITGNLVLKRPAQLTSSAFGDGFELTIPTAGDIYYRPQRDESTIESSEAKVVLISGEVEIDVLVSLRDIVRPTDPMTSRKLKLQFDRATGRFSGSALLGDDVDSTRFEGAWKWNSGFGEGLFLRGNQSAPMIFGRPDRFPSASE
jgi:hypothetical protein